MDNTMIEGLNAVARNRGHALATWWVPIDDIESARLARLLIESCKFVIPAPLSGEWDTRSLFKEASIDIDDLVDDEFDDLSTAYEEAYTEAYMEEVERMIAFHLSDATEERE